MFHRAAPQMKPADLDIGDRTGVIKTGVTGKEIEDSASDGIASLNGAAKLKRDLRNDYRSLRGSLMFGTAGTSVVCS